MNKKGLTDLFATSRFECTYKVQYLHTQYKYILSSSHALCSCCCLLCSLHSLSMHLRVRHWPLKKEEEEGHSNLFVSFFESCTYLYRSKWKGWLVYTSICMNFQFGVCLFHIYISFNTLMLLTLKCPSWKVCSKSNTTISYTIFLRYQEIIDGFVSKYLRQFEALISDNKWLSIT